MSRISVLGAGAWGTALALALARRGDHRVTLWPHRPDAAEELARDRENLRFLPGFRFPDSIQVTGDDREAVSEAEILVLATPSAFLRATMGRLGSHFRSGQAIVSAAKGIEEVTHLRMTEVILEHLAGAGLALPVGALSGPSFAQEVAAGMPAAVAVAFAGPAVAARIQREFASDTLRLYTTGDVIGVELGGALKNVIAIAAGVVAGMGLGLNSAAALVTRGLAEMTRLAVAAGGRGETLRGLSGVGDLVLTCTGPLSRNRTVGFELGRGRPLAEIMAGLGGKVAEGVLTTRAALGLARKLNVEMPIASQMESILNEGKTPREAIRDLMARPGRHEED